MKMTWLSPFITIFTISVQNPKTMDRQQNETNPVHTMFYCWLQFYGIEITLVMVTIIVTMKYNYKVSHQHFSIKSQYSSTKTDYALCK